MRDNTKGGDFQIMEPAIGNAMEGLNNTVGEDEPEPLLLHEFKEFFSEELQVVIT